MLGVRLLQARRRSQDDRRHEFGPVTRSPRSLVAVPLPGITIARTAIVLAVGSAYAELLVRAVTKVALDRQLNAGYDIVWMAPAANLMWIACAALAGWLLVRMIPRHGMAIAALSLMFTPAFLSLVWLIPKIHLEAGALLALGLAVHTARIAISRLPAFDRAMHRWTPRLVVLALVLSTSVVGWLRVREWRGMASLPDAARGSPNVLLLILDTVRSYSSSTYGYSRRTTPEISAIANRGVLFDRAFATASWTLPSHASIFTSRWPHELRAGLRDPLDADQATLAEAMATAGYATGGFAANHSFVNWEFGIDRGFIRFRDYPVNARTILASSSLGRNAFTYNTLRRLIGFHGAIQEKSAREVNAEFLDWVGDVEGRPFFAFLNYFDAHHPYVSPDSFMHKFGPSADLPYRPQEPKFAGIAAPARERLMNQYDGGIAYVDHAIGQLMDSLEARGLLENTIVVVTSDHGEHWGDHRRLSHGNSMYRQLLQVPLVLFYPRDLPQGRRIATPVSLRDLGLTILTLAGVNNRMDFDGVPLTVHLDSAAGTIGSPILATSATLNGEGASSIIADGLHYIRMMSGDEELYDVEHDSLEERNLVGDSAAAPQLEAMRALLAAELSRTHRHPADSARPSLENR